MHNLVGIKKRNNIANSHGATNGLETWKCTSSRNHPVQTLCKLSLSFPSLFLLFSIANLPWKEKISELEILPHLGYIRMPSNWAQPAERIRAVSLVAPWKWFSTAFWGFVVCNWLGLAWCCQLKGHHVDRKGWTNKPSLMVQNLAIEDKTSKHNLKVPSKNTAKPPPLNQ